MPRVAIAPAMLSFAPPDPAMVFGACIAERDFGEVVLQRCENLIVLTFSL